MFWKRQKLRIKTSKKKLMRTPFGKIAWKIILITGSVYILGWGVFKMCHALLLNLSYFNLSNVYIKNHFVLDGEDALKFAGLTRGVNIFALNLHSISSRIKQRHPEYEEVVVKRIPPDGLNILIRERTAVLQIKLAKFYPVDKNGFVIPYPKDSAYVNLPLVIGIRPEEAPLNNFSRSARIRKAIELLSAINRERFAWVKDLTKVNMTNVNDISLFLNNGLEVKIGREPYLDKISRLSKVLDEIKARGMEPSSIDLRFNDVIIVPK